MTWKGWGGEDDDLWYRIHYQKIKVQRPSPEIARYTMLKHEHGQEAGNRFNLIRRTWRKRQKDGLSSLNYKLEGVILEKLFTRILVPLKLDPKPKDSKGNSVKSKKRGKRKNS